MMHIVSIKYYYKRKVPLCNRIEYYNGHENTPCSDQLLCYCSVSECVCKADGLFYAIKQNANIAFLPSYKSSTKQDQYNAICIVVLCPSISFVIGSVASLFVTDLDFSPLVYSIKRSMEVLPASSFVMASRAVRSVCITMILFVK